jgi:hypothetical protein
MKECIVISKLCVFTYLILITYWYRVLGTDVFHQFVLIPIFLSQALNEPSLCHLYLPNFDDSKLILKDLNERTFECILSHENPLSTNKCGSAKAISSKCMIKFLESTGAEIHQNWGSTIIYEQVSTKYVIYRMVLALFKLSLEDLLYMFDSNCIRNTRISLIRSAFGISIEA